MKNGNIHGFGSSKLVNYLTHNMGICHISIRIHSKFLTAEYGSSGYFVLVKRMTMLWQKVISNIIITVIFHLFLKKSPTKCKLCLMFHNLSLKRLLFKHSSAKVFTCIRYVKIHDLIYSVLQSHWAEYFTKSWSKQCVTLKEGGSLLSHSAEHLLSS